MIFFSYYLRYATVNPIISQIGISFSSKHFLISAYKDQTSQFSATTVSKILATLPLNLSNPPSCRLGSSRWVLDYLYWVEG